MPAWAMWAACMALLAVRATYAAAESALYSTSELRLKELAKEGSRAAARLVRLKTEREGTAAALRVGMVLAGFLAAALGTLAPPRMLREIWLPDLPWIHLATPLMSVLLVGMVATILDVSARAMATASPEKTALRLSWGISFLVAWCYPFLKMLVALLNVILGPFGGRVRFEAPPPPLEELEKLLAAQAANKVVDQSAPQLIRSIFELSDKRCRDVMVPRTSVVAVDITTPPVEILRILAEENHSRVPVFRDDIDHIVGVLHSRDLIPLMQHPELIVLTDVIRPAQFVPWMKPIGDLLREMQKKKIHMAMVVDEYGGFMGVVTLEDILREIVGDIGDEFSIEERPLEKLADGSVLVDASMELGDFAKAFGQAIPEGEYETLGGFIAARAGVIPDVGERFVHDGIAFVVHSKEGPRITRVRVLRSKSPASRDVVPATREAAPREGAPAPAPAIGKDPIRTGS